MTKIGVTGYSGHVGRELIKYPDTVPLIMDVTRPGEVEMAINSAKVDVVVHLASVSDVDVCEVKENEKWVYDVNVNGTLNVAETCSELNIPVVLLSTAHVFGGKWWVSYHENDFPNPQNFYGFTKLAAESLREVYSNLKVIRTSYLFDRERLMKYVDIHRKGNYQEYPTFIVRSFMYTPHFVCVLNEYLRKIDTIPDMLHISGSKSSSWYEFMCCVAKEFDIPKEQILPRKTELKDKTPRPYRGSLNVDLSRRSGLSQYSYIDGIREIKNG